MQKIKIFKKQLILFLLLLLLLIPAIHKIMGAIPPEWFIAKFKDSLIGQLAGGITCSYCFIIILEIVGPILMFIAIIQMALKKNAQRTISIAFLVYYILFLILTFGSFLVQDYDNGFKDFMYFVALMLIERFYFSKEGESEDGEN